MESSRIIQTVDPSSLHEGLLATGLSRYPHFSRVFLDTVSGYYGPIQVRQKNCIEQTATDRPLWFKPIAISDVWNFFTALDLYFEAYCKVRLGKEPHDVYQGIADYRGVRSHKEAESCLELMKDFTEADNFEADGITSYLDRRTQELLNAGVVPPFTQSASCAILTSTSEPQFEGTQEMNFNYAFPDPDNEGDPVNVRLSSFRFGIHDRVSAVVYALQQALYEGVAISVARARLKSLDSSRAYLKDKLTTGELSSSAQEWGWIKNGELDERCIRAWMLQDKHFDSWRGRIFEINEYLWDLISEPDVEPIHRQCVAAFDANEVGLHKLKRVLNRGPERGKLHEFGAPAGGFLSFALGIQALHKQGIRRVHVPPEFPARIHSQHSDLDARIKRQKEGIVRRTAYEIEGVNLQDPLPNRYFCLELGDTLSPRRPQLQQLMA
jgi:hypothetical protein